MAKTKKDWMEDFEKWRSGSPDNKQFTSLVQELAVTTAISKDEKQKIILEEDLLWRAATLGDQQSVTTILNEVDISSIKNIPDLLYQACIYGYLDLIQWILQNKPVDLDLNKKIHLTLGQTFVERAFSGGHMDIVNEFVKHGAIFTPPPTPPPPTITTSNYLSKIKSGEVKNIEIIYKYIDHSQIEKFIKDIAISSDKVDDALNIICNAMNDEDKAQILKSSYFVQYIVCSYLAEHQEINNQNAQDILKEYGFLEQFFGWMAYFYYYLKHEVLELEYTPEYIVPLITTLDSNDS